MNKVIGCLVILTVALTVQGCTQAPKSAEDVYRLSLSAISGEDNFAYKGKTSAQVNGAEMQDMAVFDGYVHQHDQVLMNLALSNIPNESPQVWTVYSKEKKLFLKKGAKAWTPLPATDTKISSQFNNWNPVMNLAQLSKLKKTIAFAKSEQPADKSIIEMKINPDSMKQMISDELRTQFKTSTDPAYLEKLRTTLKLSDAEFAKMKQQVEASIKQSQQTLNQMLQTLKVEAVYTLISDKQTRLPLTLQMKVNSRYISQGTPIHEQTVVQYQFSRFGENFKDPRQET